MVTGTPSRAAGVVIPFWRDRPAGEAVELGLLADHLGFGEVWMGEMLHFDAFALAGALAVQTRQATITVGPLALGLRDPVQMAMGAASVSVLGDRPARLALGASSPAVVEKWHGRHWGGEADRLSTTVSLIREVLRGDRTDRLESHGFRSALGPQPAHITVAASGPRMMRAATACADRIVLNLVPVDVVRRARAAGKPVAVWLVVGVDPSPEARAQVARQMAMYLSAPGYWRVLAAAGMNEAVMAARQGARPGELAAMLTDEQVDGVVALGDEAEVARRVDSYREAGAEVMVIPVTAGDPAGQRTLSTLA
jgi:probable F420-dependent oxidoreductase